MRNRRHDLHEILCDILGSRNVYFQPPPSVMMKYPAIVYSRSALTPEFGNNHPYLVHKGYQVTIVDPNPDSTFVDDISKLPTCSFVRHYESDNLNHDVFQLYY